MAPDSLYDRVSRVLEEDPHYREWVREMKEGLEKAFADLPSNTKKCSGGRRLRSPVRRIRKEKQ